MSNAAARITQNFVFSHPTIKQLSTRVVELVRGDPGEIESPSATIEKMIEKYSVGLGPICRSDEAVSDHAVVLLTGSTGGLGSFILEALLKHPRVRKIYAYNRPSKNPVTVEKRQEDAFDDKGLDTKILNSEKLVYLEGDSALPTLGLSIELYNEVR